MPEGDSVRLAARRMHDGLAGRRIVASQFRVPSLAAADLCGAVVREFAPYGKHMLLRTDTALTLHTHFRMDGSWALLGPGKRLPRRLEAEAVRRLAADPDRPVVEALLDQRTVAGIGNLWAVETLFLRGVSPWALAGSVEAEPLLRLARRTMTYALTHPAQVTTGDTPRGRTHWVYGRAGQPCLRCGTPVQVRDATGRPYERETWWCPVCQPGPAPDLAARPWRAGLSRGRPAAQAGSRLTRGRDRTGGSGQAR